MIQESVAIEERAAQIQIVNEIAKRNKAEKLAAARENNALRKLSLNNALNGVTLVDENVEEGSVRARAIEILTVREAIDAGEVEIQLGNEKLEKKRKYNSKRPENWRVITQYYIDNGFIHLRFTSN